MMRIRLSRDGVALALALTAIATLAVLREARQPHSDVETFSSYDARPGGYRAWYELLEREGVRPARFEERAAYLDQAMRTLIIGDAAPFLAALPATGESDPSSVAAWVRNGGRLLLAGSGSFSAFARGQLHLAQATTADGHEHVVFIAPVLRRFGVRSVDAQGDERLAPRRGDAVLLRDRRGVVALRSALGRGSVVQIVDGKMFRNDALAEPDRARFAYALVALQGSAARGVFFDEAVHGYLTPEHWWQVMPRPFVAAILLALAVLGVALAGAATRLGSPVGTPAPRVRPGAEYLDAMAALTERARAANGALAVFFESTRRLLARRAGLPLDAPFFAVAERLDDEDARRAFLDLNALALRRAGDAAALVRGARLAHQLRGEDAPS